MKMIRKHLSGLAIIGGLIASLNFVHGQMTARAVQAVSAEDMAVMLQAVEMTTPQAAESVPKSGTFYSAQFPNWPPLPCNINNVPVWNLGDGVFLLSDLDVNYSQRPLASSMTTGGMRAMDGLSPGGDDSGGGTYTPDYFTPTPPDYGTNLWIAQVGISSGSLVGIVSNSLADISYEIQSLTDLTQAGAGWVSEGFILGSETTNWTPMSVAQNGRTNLFLRIRSWADDGSGLPLWWQLQYFGTTGVDPFAFDPSGDGFTLWQAFVEGLNPTVFNTPAAPRGLTVNYNSANGNVNVSWQPSPGAVTGYTVERVFGYWSGGTTEEFNFSPGTSGFVDNISSATPDPWLGDTLDVSYKIQAHYAGGDSAWSDPVPLQPSIISANIIAGPQGSAYLAVSFLPSETVALHVTRIDEATAIWDEFFGADDPYSTNFDIPVTNPTNGLYLIPSAWSKTLPGPYGGVLFDWWVQTVNTNGSLSAATICPFGGYNNYPVEDTNNYVWLVPPYFDGRAQLKQNLIFLLRAATVDSPFNYLEINISPNSFYTFTNPPSYAYAGFYQLDEIADRYPYFEEDVGSFDAYWPFENNYRYRNFVFGSTNLDGNGRITTGAGGNYYDNYDYGSGEDFPSGLMLMDPPAFQFQPPTTSGATIPSLLATNGTRWLATYALDSPSYWLWKIGATNYGGVNGLFSNVRNWYGLPILSANLSGTTILYAGYTTTAGGYFYPETAQPQLQTVEYDFWNHSPVPGMSNFSTSQTNDLLITSVGNPNFSVNSYAKLAVQNGYNGVYAYLGQYFDKTYKINTNGIMTTNMTGVLSPYGSFFATEPGPVALVTMPDVDTGARGTCTVYCVSLVLDKNHDGTMDTSFSGQDATSQASPMIAWVNGDNDSTGIGNDLEVYTNSTADYTYGKIRSQRNLEDFFRLWVCGLPKLPTSSGYTVTFSMSPSSGNPAINLYPAYESDGGTKYLMDTNVAAAQLSAVYVMGTLVTDYNSKLATINSTQGYTLPVDGYGNPVFTHFLFEGAGIGEGQLTMTISQNGNTIAQTSVWLDLHDIKDLYEQAHASNIDITGPPSTKISTLLEDKTLAANPAEDKQLIVFVHGMNNSVWEYYNDSETMFKRLYWQGYHGRFASFRWPSPLFTFIPTTPSEVSYFGFNQGEYISWKAGTALKNYIGDLRSRLSGYTIDLAAHSLGNAAANEAIREGAQVDNYVLMQAAVSAGAFDGSANLIYNYLASATNASPDGTALGGYRNCFTNQCRRVNFYNDDDWALFNGPFHMWEGNQLLFKPDHTITFAGWFYEFDGTNCFFNIRDGNGEILTTRTLTEDFEKKAYVACSRTKAVGAAGLKYTPFTLTGGTISTNISLQNINMGFVGGAAFGTTRPEHSGEFTKPIQNAIPFYRALLDAGFDIRPKL